MSTGEANYNEKLKQPKLLKLWSEMTRCKFDETKFANDSNDTWKPSESNSCRGFYRKITDLMQDGYLLYKTNEMKKNEKNRKKDDY
jgi:hypothetical protein